MAICIYCKGAFERAHSSQRTCRPCNVLRCAVLADCRNAFAAAKRKGLFTNRPIGMACVDCDDDASEWEHRDYRKPLDVVPVCGACNAQRGPGAFADGHDHLLSVRSGRYTRPVAPAATPD